MPTTTTLTASDTGAFDNWTLGAGGSKAAAVDPPDDDDNTYIEESTNGERQAFVTDDLPTEAFRVTTHTLVRRIRRTGGTAAASIGFLRLSAVNTDSGTALHGTAYGATSNVDLAKPGGGTYSDPADVNATQIGVALDSGDSPIRCTTLKWDVTWEHAAGGLVFLIGSLIGPALGAAVLLREIPGLAAFLHQVTRRGCLRHRRKVPDCPDCRRGCGGHLIWPEEYRSVWEELRAPRRRYA